MTSVVCTDGLIRARGRSERRGTLAEKVRCRGRGVVVGVALAAGGLLGAVMAPASASAAALNAPIVGSALTPDGGGYWLAAGDGGVFAEGDAGFYGSMGGKPLNQPVVGISPTPGGRGYVLAAADGGVFAFGDASFHGSLAGQHLNGPVVGIAETPDGGGYWLAAADGGVFAEGDAGFYGSMGGKPLNQPVVGISPTPGGRGYVLAAADGGVFAFGDASFHGSLAGQHLNGPVVGIAETPDGGGYWLAAADGGVFAEGDAGFYGSMGGKELSRPVVSINTTHTGQGYTLVGGDGGVFAFGDAQYHGSLPAQGITPAPLPIPASGRCTSAPGPGNAVTRWGPAVTCVLGMLHQAATPSLVSDVFMIIAGESGGDPRSINLTDSNAAAGHPSQGLMQTIASTFEAYRSSQLPDNIVDPAASIYAGLNYGIHRYGSITDIPGVRSVHRGGPYIGYGAALAGLHNVLSLCARESRRGHTLAVVARGIGCRAAAAVVGAFEMPAPTAAPRIAHARHIRAGGHSAWISLRTPGGTFSCRLRRPASGGSAALSHTRYSVTCDSKEREVMWSAR